MTFLWIYFYYKQVFAKDKSKNTIKTRDPAMQNVIGNSKTHSFGYIKIVSLMYNCSSECIVP